MNRSTRLFTVIIGVVTGFTGSIHGLFEVMQGNRPTGGFVMGMIGAVTFVQNYLVTGVLAMAAGTAVVCHSLFFIHRKHGVPVYLLLCAVLFLCGGGVACLSGIILGAYTASRIGQPLNGWGKILPSNLQRLLAGLWIYILAAGFLFLGIGIAIWLFILPPGKIHHIDTVQIACWASLLSGLFLLLLSIIAGFARDISQKIK